MPTNDRDDLPRGFPMELATKTITLGKPTCQVNSVYSDAAIPSWKVLGDNFVNRIAELFLFEAVPIDMEKKFQAFEQMKGLVEDADSAANQLTRMQFYNGLYVKEGQDAAKNAFRIEDLAVSPRQIYVRIQGDTETAIEICDLVAREICTAANIAVSDLESEKQYVDFSTASKVKLGAPLGDVLSDRFKAFLVEELANGPCYGRFFVPKELLSPESDVVVVPSVYAIRTNLRIMDMSAGTAYREILSIYAEDALDEAKGIFIIQSKLPTKDHLAMCEALVRRLKVEDTGSKKNIQANK